jgi:hypothetical protein
MTTDANGNGHKGPVATYTLEDFIDELVDEAIAAHITRYDNDGEEIDSGDYVQDYDAAHNLKLSKRQLGYLCADALENLGLLNCVWCGIHTGKIGEFYMVKDDLWDRYGCANGCACIGCLEQSMGRRLRCDDFRIRPDADLTTAPSDHMSERLRDRLGIMALFDVTQATDTAPQP